MELKISLALHLIGMAMWVGSLLVLTRLFKIFTKPSSQQGELPAILGRLLFGYALPGLVLSTITGLYQMGYVGFATYLRQGWFHGKLTLVLLLVVVTGLCFINLRKVRTGAALSSGLVAAMHGLVGFILIAVVFMTVMSGMYFSALGMQG